MSPDSRKNFDDFKDRKASSKVKINILAANIIIYDYLRYGEESYVSSYASRVALSFTYADYRFPSRNLRYINTLPPGSVCT